MFIEIFPNEQWIIWSFRHSWTNKAIKPKQENIYKINKQDFKRLVLALDHTAMLWTPIDYDFNSWNLYLKIIDNANYYWKKWQFLENTINN